MVTGVIAFGMTRDIAVVRKSLFPLPLFLSIVVAIVVNTQEEYYVFSSGI